MYFIFPSCKLKLRKLIISTPPALPMSSQVTSLPLLPTFPHSSSTSPVWARARQPRPGRRGRSLPGPCLWVDCWCRVSSRRPAGSVRGGRFQRPLLLPLCAPIASVGHSFLEILYFLGFYYTELSKFSFEVAFYFFFSLASFLSSEPRTMRCPPTCYS